MSGTVCCYSGCKKSYSTDKDTVSFFKFPDDPKRRKKWMQNCGNPELETLSDRQLRGKRICSDHFTQKCFLSKTTLNDSAVPNVAKVSVTSEKVDKPSETVTTPSQQKRGRGRSSVKSESQEVKSASVETATEDEVPETPIPEPTPPSKRRRTETPKAAAATAAKQVKSAEPPAKLRSPSPTKSSTVTATVDTPSTMTTTRSGRKVTPKPVQEEPTSTQTKSVETSTEDEVSEPTPTPPASPTKRRRGNANAAKEDHPKVVPSESPTKPPDTPTPTGRGGRKAATKSTQPEGVGNRNIPATSSISNVSNETVTVETTSTEVGETEAVAVVDPKPATLTTTPVAKKRKANVNANTDSSKGAVTSSPASAVVNKAPATVTLVQVPTASPKAKTVPTTATTPVAASRVVKKVSTKTPEVTPTKPTMSSLAKMPGLTPIATTAASKKKKAEASKTAPTPPSTASKSHSAISIQAGTATTAKAATGIADLAARMVKKAAPKPQSQSQPQQKSPLEVASTIPNLRDIISKSTPVKSKIEMKTPQKEILLSSSSKGPRLALLPQIQQQCEPQTSSSLAGVSIGINEHSDTDSYDEYMFYDREFDDDFEEQDDPARVDREFERFYASLKKFLNLTGKWTMGGVQWDPQGKRKVIIISEPEIPPHGRPSLKRCLQFFEDKVVRVFLDGMDMTDAFGMTCYAEKEDVASLINRVASASSCCGVPEMVQDDLVNFPETKKRNTSYFDVNCPGVIPNDAYDPTCEACKNLQVLVLESRENEKLRLLERRLRSEEKNIQHSFGKVLYTFFNDLCDETDPSKPKKKRNKETFFRKFLHDTRLKTSGDTTRTERVYIEKPISVDSVSASFQDIVSKLGFNMPNAKKGKPAKPVMVPKPAIPLGVQRARLAAANQSALRKMPMSLESLLPFATGPGSFTLDDGQEYELIGEVEPASASDLVEVKPNASQYEIIEVDGDTLAKITSTKNQLVMFPEAQSNYVTRIDANDPNLSQILKAINTSHGFKG